MGEKPTTAGFDVSSRRFENQRNGERYYGAALIVRVRNRQC